MPHNYHTIKSVTIIYKGYPVQTRIVYSRREVVKQKLYWRKMYGQKFRHCTFEIIYND